VLRSRCTERLARIRACVTITRDWAAAGAPKGKGAERRERAAERNVRFFGGKIPAGFECVHSPAFLSDLSDDLSCDEVVYGPLLMLGAGRWRQSQRAATKERKREKEKETER